MKYFCIVDFECTCDSEQKLVKEIIEFAAVFVNPMSYEIEFEFRRLVRPVENPILTEYCISLTGLSQAHVDDALTLSEILAEFADFTTSNDIAFQLVTDCSADVVKFLAPECRRKRIPLPRWSLKWLDLGLLFKAKFSLEARRSLRVMLDMCGLEMEGTHHRGIDDARNIAQLLIYFAKSGAKVTTNKNLPTLAIDVFQ